MAWVSAYDEATRESTFVQAPYSHFQRYCFDTPKKPVCAESSVTGICQRHLLHIWKFLYSLYQTEEAEAAEVKKVLDYVVCELNFAAHTWTSDSTSSPAVIHCLQRLKMLIQHLKSQLKTSPRESDQTLDFYLRKQLPALKNDIASCKHISNEMHLVTFVQSLQDIQREAPQEVGTAPSPTSAFEEISPLYSAEVLPIAASEPVTPFSPIQEPVTMREKPKVVAVEELSTGRLWAEMWGQLPSTDPLQAYRSQSRKAKGSVNYTIYKDSPAYQAYSKNFAPKKSLVLDFPLPKVTQAALEDHANLDLVDKGKWLVPDQAPKSGSRRPDKTFLKSVTMRQRVDSRPILPTTEVINEDEERRLSELSLSLEKNSSTGLAEQEGQMKQLKETMQSLASLSSKEPDKLKLTLHKPELRPVLGRKPAIKK